MTIKRITAKEKFKTIAQGWKIQYFSDNDMKWYPQKLAAGESAETIYNLLLFARTPKKVDEIIGNESWTQEFCQECRNYSKDVLEFTDEDNKHIYTVCISCIKKSLINL